MDLSHKSGTLRVNYSDRLVSLLREVRQLTGLGYPVPAKIQQCANTAQKFYKHAIVLKQVQFQDSILSSLDSRVLVAGGPFLQYNPHADVAVPTKHDVGCRISIRETGQIA